jgi:hypothetical protein
MAPRRRTFNILSAVVLLLTIVLAVPSPTIAQADKDQCKRGGWMELSPDGVTLFRNQGQCVSHVVHGGELLAIASLQVTWNRDGTAPVFGGRVAGAGLQPGADIFLHVVSAGGTFDLDVGNVESDGTADTMVASGLICGSISSIWVWSTTATGHVIETVHDIHPC